jgi:hypothetical protein
VVGPSLRLRCFAAAIGVYFVFAAALQWNDPDALAWGGFYCVAAGVSFFAVWRFPPAWVPRLIAIVATIWAGVIAPLAFKSSFADLFATWEMMSPRMEAGREFLGLVIVVVWMLSLGRRAAKAMHPQ